MSLVWEGETQSHCVIEHNRGKLFLFTDSARDSHCLLFCDANLSSTNDWQNLLVEEPGITLLDVDFCDTHMVLILKQDNKFRLCSVKLPLPSNVKGPVRLSDLCPNYMPLPDHVCQITSGPNYDFSSSIMCFTISSPVMPDAVVDYNLLNGKWTIVQQQNLLHESIKILYGASFASPTKENQALDNNRCNHGSNGSNVWNDLLDYYECQYYYADSMDKEVSIPLTVVYSKKHKKDEAGPGLLHGHGAYGEVMDRRWRSELKSLLDRGWVIAFADVRGGGGHGKKWHQDGTRTKKINSINDFVSCAEFLVEKKLVKENRLAAWGYSAGGLLVASAINAKPSLFRTAILKVPFLDVLNTLLRPILPLTPIDYHEFGYPIFLEDFQAIKEYSPYENIKKDALYPAVMITSSLSTRFGVWEAAKWAARACDLTIYDPQRPIVLNMTTDIVEDSKYLQTKELAIETAFLLKTVADP
ncbi:hypothetical protein LUZ63_001446 [Rhynchospora breviuscula]|uniref:Prolyl endopeptidase n=1 Tax=Rhynchospora breviuscula TaxID=2022672 RepID=A0A9Q0HX26_9POAL|nr:hypothetical protein LUZ63_001446 [Rhynchospora breviuscula]